MEEEDDDEEEWTCKIEVLLNGNVFNLGRVYCSPHDIDPSFSRHTIEYRNHCPANIVKVLVWIHPLAAII